MRRLILIITLLTLMLAFGTTVFAQGDVAHVVQPGENLFRISLRYNVPMATIAARNGIT
ncbi:MAG: LysM peptidoglycan-binding domain-containing protein, partial [Anaerolineae bacterium]|nr:LysM peptidoglycan-binding domain-containing protein [Anaerolineae bacterium]